MAVPRRRQPPSSRATKHLSNTGSLDSKQKAEHRQHKDINGNEIPGHHGAGGKEKDKQVYHQADKQKQGEEGAEALFFFAFFHFTAQKAEDSQQGEGRQADQSS